MNIEDRKHLLNTLVDLQKTTSPVVVSIGHVFDGTVSHEHIVLKEAAPFVTQELIQRGYHLDITSNGVIVDKY